MVVMHHEGTTYECRMGNRTGQRDSLRPSETGHQVGSGLTTLSIFTTKKGAVEKEARDQR